MEEALPLQPQGQPPDSQDQSVVNILATGFKEKGAHLNDP